MSNTIQSLRGMKDLTGAESELFIYFIKKTKKDENSHPFITDIKFENSSKFKD